MKSIEDFSLLYYVAKPHARFGTAEHKYMKAMSKFGQTPPPQKKQKVRDVDETIEIILSTLSGENKTLTVRLNETLFDIKRRFCNLPFEHFTGAPTNITLVKENGDPILFGTVEQCGIQHNEVLNVIVNDSVQCDAWADDMLRLSCVLKHIIPMSVYDITFFPTRPILLICNKLEKKLHICKINAGAENSLSFDVTKTFYGVDLFTCSTDGNRMATRTSAELKIVRIWDTSSVSIHDWEVDMTIRTTINTVHSFELSHDGSKLAIAHSETPTIAMWDLNIEELMYETVQQHPNDFDEIQEEIYIRSIQFSSPEDNTFAYLEGSNLIFLAIDTGNLLNVFDVGEYDEMISNRINGTLVYTTDYTDYIRVLNKTEHVKTIDVDKSKLYYPLVTPDGKYCLTLDETGELHVIDLTTGTLFDKGKISKKCKEFSISGDGTYVVVSSETRAGIEISMYTMAGPNTDENDVKTARVVVDFNKDEEEDIISDESEVNSDDSTTSTVQAAEDNYFYDDKDE